MREMTIRTRIRSSARAVGAAGLAGGPARRATDPSGRASGPAGRPSGPAGLSGSGDQAGPGGDTFEWDMRQTDGPTDRAFYDCGCGYKFTARVATTVSCPHCGAGQAW